MEKSQVTGEEARTTVRRVRQREKSWTPEDTQSCRSLFERKKQQQNKNEQRMPHLFIINKQITLMNIIIKEHFVNIHM